MQLYIDPGTGSMLFTVLISIIGAGIYSLRMLWIKIRFRISGGKIEASSEKIPFVISMVCKLSIYIIRKWNLNKKQIHFWQIFFQFSE